MVNFIELSLMTHLSQKVVSNTHVHACVCMYIIYAYIYQCLHVRMYAYFHLFACACRYASCLHVCLHVYIKTFACMHVRMYACLHVCMLVHVQ